MTPATTSTAISARTNAAAAPAPTRTSLRPVCCAPSGSRRSATNSSSAPSIPAPYSSRSASLTRSRQRTVISRASRRLRTARRGSRSRRLSQYVSDSRASGRADIRAQDRAISVPGDRASILPDRMARDWQDLFLLDHDAPAAAQPEPEREEGRRGFFKRLRENMRKTREALAAEVQATLFEGDLDEQTWERLEEALIYADVGARTTAQVVEELEREAEEGNLVGGEALSTRLAELLAQL